MYARPAEDCGYSEACHRLLHLMRKSCFAVSSLTVAYSPAAQRVRLDENGHRRKTELGRARVVCFRTKKADLFDCEDLRQRWQMGKIAEGHVQWSLDAGHGIVTSLAFVSDSRVGGA